MKWNHVPYYVEHGSVCQEDMMNEKSENQESVERRVRADAQRNIDSLLQAALEVFKTSGVDAPVREIAEKAGVGIGTLYRHFPQRADLVAAVFRREIDTCADAASTLAEEHEPFDALARWIQRYTAFVATKRGLASALHSGDPVFEPLPGYFSQRLRPAFQMLLDAAVAAGEVRPDIDVNDLLSAITYLCHDENPDRARRMVALLIDGLRYSANASGHPTQSGGK
jgi:AcrR family transcriptional regulator